MLANRCPTAAEYVLTNAHRRRLLIGMNARELYHVSRLREDKHAQWDIRNISTKMLEQAKQVMPLTLLLTCGKHQYSEAYEEIYGKRPDMEVPNE
jgi:thymidylate synthase ThyX